jgi:hypothetical protein
MVVPVPLKFIFVIDQRNRSNTTCYAHENQSKYSAIAHLDRKKTISHTYKHEFLAKKLGSVRQLQDKLIEIRFIFEKSDVV